MDRCRSEPRSAFRNSRLVFLSRFERRQTAAVDATGVDAAAGPMAAMQRLQAFTFAPPTTAVWRLAAVRAHALLQTLLLCFAEAGFGRAGNKGAEETVFMYSCSWLLHFAPHGALWRFTARWLYKDPTASNNARKRHAARKVCASSTAAPIWGDRLRTGLTNPNEVCRPTPPLLFAKAVVVGITVPDRG